MDYIKQAAENAGLKIIDYGLKFSPSLDKSYAKIENVIFHHDVWPGGTMEKIHVDHLVNQKYRGTGYHGRFPMSGGIELGRPHGMIGAHCKQQQMNYKSIGLVWEGNLDKTEMTDEQFRDSTKFLAEYIKLTGQSIDKFFGHGQFANKSCPGKNFQMLKIKRRVQELLDQDEHKAAPWATSGQKFVLSKKYNGETISDGKRPADPLTRQEQWVMMERFYNVIINDVQQMIEEAKQC